MKEASGELSMTVITVIAVGAIIAFFWVMYPTIKNTIMGTWGGVSSSGCIQWDDNGNCVKRN